MFILRKNLLLFLLLLMILLPGAMVFAADQPFTVPQLVAPVNDNAHLLNQTTQDQVNRALRELYKQGGAQIAVLTVPSLQGLTIEQASIQITDVWKLGQKGRDNGVLLMIAAQEHALRIEVGQGLEGVIPDAIAKRIVDETITPLFKSGDYSGGVLAGTFAIAERANPELAVKEIFDYKGSTNQDEDYSGAASKLLLFLILCLLALTPTGRALLLMLIAFGGRGGRGGGGSSDGGGGYSGGGGGFSGGGASGKW